MVNRCHLIGGPFHGNCAVLEIHGRSVCDREVLAFRKTPDFRGTPSIILASPCEDGEHLYRQQRDDKGTPVLNIVDDILYDFIEPDEVVRGLTKETPA